MTLKPFQTVGQITYHGSRRQVYNMKKTLGLTMRG